jgi:GH15 family glucan-1,4-alpha-glucosidase
MSRSSVLGNGKLLVGLDRCGQVRDFYFPYAGHANHVSGASGSYMHRVGVWVDGTVHWLSEAGWSITTTIPDGGVMSGMRAVHDGCGIALTFEDAVHNEQNVFIRGVTVVNLREHARDVRLFFGQEFRISESRRGDTAFYDPRVHAIIHYKGHNTFLVHATYAGRGFDDYSVGLFDIEGKSGTFKDAEDGILSKNAVEHGSVDSVIGVHIPLAPRGEARAHYWIVASDSVRNAHTLQGYVLTETPERLLASTERYWSAWAHKGSEKLGSLDASLEKLYRQSLMVMKVHADARGGIIASSDTDILNQGRDTYSYVWPRDSAFTALAFSRAGYFDVAERYFTFMAARLEPGGYLMHKYRVDGVLGSSWHPWVRNGLMELPIQEDETAIVLYALGEHYLLTENVEFIESLYNSFIEPAADFLAGYVDGETGLPLSSYDLWEEKYGTSTYTAASVYGALISAERFSALLGKRENAGKYRASSERIQRAIMNHLYNPHTNTFVKLVRHEQNGTLSVDATLDMSSMFGIMLFEVLPVSDVRMKRAFETMREALLVPGHIGGYMRYEGDNYYRTGSDVSPNPWCITTAWVAQYVIRTARTKKELEGALPVLTWMAEQAGESAILPEQLNPLTGAHLSTAPLVWSHAEYVNTLLAYEKKYRTLRT